MRIILTIRMVLAIVSCATAQEQGDSRAGRAVAHDACSMCHAVEPGAARSPDRHAPPFQEAADTPGTTATALLVWLQTSHPTMPNLLLDPKDKRDVIAYILSLR